jgi:hypothetical protein
MILRKSTVKVSFLAREREFFRSVPYRAISYRNVPDRDHDHDRDRAEILS